MGIFSKLPVIGKTVDKFDIAGQAQAGMSGKKSGPAPPDYSALAKQQAESQNQQLTQQTWANRADQTNPFGSSKWEAHEETDPVSGQKVTKWGQTTTMDPALKAGMDAQLGLQTGRQELAQSQLGRYQNEFGSQMDTSGLGQFADPGSLQAGGLQANTGTAFGFGGPTTSANGLYGARAPQYRGPGIPGQTTGANGQQFDTSRDAAPQLNTGLGSYAGEGLAKGLDFGGAQQVQGADASRQRAEDAIYQSSASRLDPAWQQRQQQQENQLAQRGITRGSSAYSKAMDDFGRSRNDAYQQAQMGAITGAGAEAQRNQGMDLGLRQQQVGEIGQQAGFQNAAQQQAFAQRFGSEEAQNAALGQQFNFGQQARGSQLQGQQAQLGQEQQAYTQGMGNYNAGLAGNQQQFNQGLAGNQFNLGKEQQAFSQGQATDQSYLQQLQQAFNQQQQAGSQNFNQNLQQQQFQNQQRQQQLAEMMGLRGQSFGELNSMLNAPQITQPQFSGYSAAGQGQGVDYMGAAQQGYQGQMNQFNQQQAQQQQLYQGLGTAAMMMFSDRRLKAEIRRVGRHRRGFGIYSYRYIGERGRRLGVIAQEVQRVAPELVRSVGGTLQVNYGGL